jgi:hypothetical protein
MTPLVRAPFRRCQVLLVAGALALAGCGDNAPPTKRPADLSVRYSWNLAPADVQGELAIASGRASYREKRGDSVVHFAFTPTRARLDALWQVLRRNRVDTLKTEKHRPGLRRAVETLRVRWGDRAITLYDGVKVGLRPGDRARWRHIQLALRGMILRQRRKRGLPAY